MGKEKTGKPQKRANLRNGQTSETGKKDNLRKVLLSEKEKTGCSIYVTGDVVRLLAKKRKGFESPGEVVQRLLGL